MENGRLIPSAERCTAKKSVSIFPSRSVNFWTSDGVLAKRNAEEYNFKFQRFPEIFLKPMIHCSDTQDRLHLEEEKKKKGTF